LRGSNGSGRYWWDVKHYDLEVTFDTLAKSISGINTITFTVLDTARDTMQIDLQEPMTINSVSELGNNFASITADHQQGTNVWWIIFPHDKTTHWSIGQDVNISIEFKGAPRRAVNPPWDGGFVWTHDSIGHPWIAVACQGLGASVWWPCKDVQWDEPDSGMDIRYVVPGGLTCVSNGRLIDKKELNQQTTQWHWKICNPINNYDATFYIGDYVHWQDTLAVENGVLDLDFYALSENEAKAKKQFEVVKPMLHCFEYWMGPYPFYKDGYKLIEAPYLGMEHQSAVAYGNKYEMGYLGYDRSGTGVGMNFDFIIVHESGHEWFGNSITAKDIADNWIHEGITTYSESLFAECQMGKEKGQAYCRGEWKNIRNDKPIIGYYGVNDEGSSDMYDKGAAVMYMIRQQMNDDEKFRQMLRGLSSTFYHQTVTTQDIEHYISTFSGIDLSAFFNQYLRTINIPQLQYYIKGDTLHYRFSNIVPNFTLPVKIDDQQIIRPTDEWQQIDWKDGKDVKLDKNYLLTINNIKDGASAK
jgi:aminopeptidase N